MTLIEFMKSLDLGSNEREVEVYAKSPLDDGTDFLLGSCVWDGQKITCYDCDELFDENSEVVKHAKFCDGSISVWVEVDWSGDDVYDLDVQRKIAKRTIKPVLDWYRKRITRMFQIDRSPLRTKSSEELDKFVNTYLSAEELFLEILEDEKDD